MTPAHALAGWPEPGGSRPVRSFVRVADDAARDRSWARSDAKAKQARAFSLARRASASARLALSALDDTEGTP